MTYSDEHLQNHELNYWLTGFNPPLHHASFYQSFFDFKELNDKKVVEVGCGGSPITEYNDISVDLSLVDPILDKLIIHERYKHLSKHKIFSYSMLDFKENHYDYAVCLNVVDHFNDIDCLFVDKFWGMLKENGKLWLYYDVRSEDAGDHLALDNGKILEKIENLFTIEKINFDINPIHTNWSSIYKSVRIIASKK